MLEVHKKYRESVAEETDKVDLDNINEIVLDNVAVAFEKREVLQGVKCRFQKGKIYKIRGGNGTGKTSIGNLLMRNIWLSHGKIRYKDMDINRLSRSA